MGFRCGIVGLPNVGKSTLFNALTETAAAQAANYPFCTIEPNVGRVAVPDPRLHEIARIAGSKATIETQLEFVDIAGLVRGASTGEGLGNQFLGNIREVDAIAHVVRCFEDADITHVSNTIDPVAPDPDDQNTPALWRSRTGAFTAAGAGPFTPAANRPNWEVVARGIDDFQVEYLNGGGAWANTPGSVYCTSPCNPAQDADVNRIVRQVRITISARAVAGGRIQGGTKAAAGSGAPDAIRGRLVAVIAPRAALTAMAINPSAAARWY